MLFTQKWLLFSWDSMEIELIVIKIVIKFEFNVIIKW